MITEVFALWDAKQREAALLKRRRSTKSAGTADAAGKADRRGSKGSGALASALGVNDGSSRRLNAVNTGQLDVALNPLFASGASGDARASSAAAAIAASSASALDAVRAFSNAPPPMEMWRVFSTSYQDLHAQAAAAAEELAALKSELAKARGDGPAERTTPGSRTVRQQFQPQLVGAGSSRGLDVYASKR